jgi:hypothetical protein
MSQPSKNTITRQIKSESTNDAVASESWSGTFDADPMPESGAVLVETYADRLMDELFGDVERILAGGVKLPEEPVKPEVIAPHPVKVPQIAFPPSLRPQPQMDGELSLVDGDLDLFSSQPESPVEKHRKSRRSLDRLLLGAGCLSVIATLGVWLALQQKVQLPTPSASVAVENLKERADQQFMAYLQRSLEAIRPKSSQESTVASATPNANLPTVTVKGNPPSPKTAGATKLAAPQRIYIPYQQPPALPGGVATAPSSSAAVVPANPSRPRASTPSTPTVAHTLTGLLELGDRSAALFEINSVTQRFQVGESIGTSGWTLVEISKNQAIVRRNGEVRSIFVGQKL